MHERKDVIKIANSKLSNKHEVVDNCFLFYVVKTWKSRQKLANYLSKGNYSFIFYSAQSAWYTAMLQLPCRENGTTNEPILCSGAFLSHSITDCRYHLAIGRLLALHYGFAALSIALQFTGEFPDKVLSTHLKWQVELNHIAADKQWVNQNDCFPKCNCRIL